MEKKNIIFLKEEIEMKGTFSFENNNIREINISDILKLQIIPIDHDIAQVLFFERNNNNNLIDVPTFITASRNNEVLNPERLGGGHLCFLFLFQSNYKIFNNGEQIIEFGPQYQSYVRTILESRTFPAT